MDAESHMDNLRVLLKNQGLNEKEQKTLINALYEIMKDGGAFTLTTINTELYIRGLPEIDNEILDAFLSVLVMDFKYTVDTHTVH